MSDVSIRTIRAMLQGRASELAAMMAPGGFERGGLYEAPNPTRGDRKAGSFKIYTRGAAAGKWVDYAGVNAPFAAGGDRGDIIDLIAYCRCEGSRQEARKQAIRWARDWLGLSTLTQAERDRLTEQAQRMKLRAAAKEKDAQDHKIRRACELFLQARVGLVGTVVQRYLMARAIDILDIPTFNFNDVRFHPGLEYFQGAEWEEHGGRRVKVRPGPSFPAMVCGFRNRVGAVTGVHCTYLRPDGSDKADIPKAKLMLGQIAESVIRLTHGAGNIAPEQITQQRHPSELAETLLVEGVEDGGSFAATLPDLRIWVAGSLGNLGNVYLDHPCIGDVTVARDNDWQSPQAVKQFEHAMARLEAHGKPITEMSAIAGKDFNDLLRM